MIFACPSYPTGTAGKTKASYFIVTEIALNSLDGVEFSLDMDMGTVAVDSVPPDSDSQKVTKYANKNKAAPEHITDTTDTTEGASASAGVKFTVDEMWMLVEQIVDGMHYLHSHGVYHRDLKMGEFHGTAKNVRLLECLPENTPDFCFFRAVLTQITHCSHPECV